MKTKFNIIDAVILIVVIAVIAVGCFIYLNMTDDTVAVTNTAKIEFKIEVIDLTEDAANSFNAGDSVTLGETTSGSGVITAVQVTPYKKWVENTEDGEVVISEVPGRYTATVTIASEVSKTDTAYTSGSEEISVGKKMPFNAKGAASEESYIVDLYEVK